MLSVKFPEACKSCKHFTEYAFTRLLRPENSFIKEILDNIWIFTVNFFFNITTIKQYGFIHQHRKFHIKLKTSF